MASTGRYLGDAALTIAGKYHPPSRFFYRVLPPIRMCMCFRVVNYFLARQKQEQIASAIHQPKLFVALFFVADEQIPKDKQQSISCLL